MGIFRKITVCILFLSSCNTLSNSGMHYQKKLIFQKDNTTIYCYRLSWGLLGDSEAWYLSTNKEVCQGFDSTKDICFGEGISFICYNIKNNLIQIYTNRNPIIPKRFPIVINFVHLDLSEANKYEKDFKEGKIKKIEFDTIVQEVPCDRIPYTTALNMKFKI